MKKYVIFCYSDGEGGGQNYVNSKVLWLEKNGFEPIVFYPGHRIVDKKPYIVWNNLTRFVDNRCTALYYRPDYLYSFYVKKTIKWMSDIIMPDGDEIIIESPTDHFAAWGELLAEHLRAKHLCFILDELLNDAAMKEFLYYKYVKHELVSIKPTSVKLLFSGYKDVAPDENAVLIASNYGSVQDIDSEEIDKIPKYDYNIGYFGRNKVYCDNIVKGVEAFAKSHEQQTIGFLVLGEVPDTTDLEKMENVHVFKLGFLHPVPKSFFQHVDVVIAGSGCATISSLQNVPTIVAEPVSCMSSGILGYTTFDSLFNESEKKTFDAELENVLIKRVTDELPYHAKNVTNPDESFQNHIRYIDEFVHKDEYFDFKKHPQSNRLLLKKMVFPALILRDTIRYIKQIKNNNKQSDKK